MTTIHDNFNRANADALGTSSEGWSWTEVSGDTDIVSNAASAQADGRSRADSDLATANHYAQAVVAQDSGSANEYGVCVRFSSSAQTCYMGQVVKNGAANGDKIIRLEAGTPTTVAQATPSSRTPPFTVRLEVDGSSLTLKVDGVTAVSGSDSGITGNLRTGLTQGVAAADQVRFDDFEAGDIGTPSPVPKMFVVRSNLQLR